LEYIKGTDAVFTVPNVELERYKAKISSATPLNVYYPNAGAVK